MYYIIVDIDGTIVDNTHRAHLMPETDKDDPHAWTEFNRACIADKPIDHVIGYVMNALHHVEFAKLVFITSRGQSARAATAMQLMDLFGLYDYRLIMRDMDNHQSPADYKRDALRGLLQPHDDGIIFDDHPEIIQMVKDHYPNLIPVLIDSQCASVTK